MRRDDDAYFFVKYHLFHLFVLIVYVMTMIQMLLKELTKFFN